MGAKSRTKGKSGELEFVHLAKEQGFDRAERRAPMQCADGDERHADLANVGRLWAEVKRHRRVNVQREMGVLLGTERPGFVRVLFHRDDHGPALATLEASELLKLERDAFRNGPALPVLGISSCGDGGSGGCCSSNAPAGCQYGASVCTHKQCQGGKS